MPQLTRSLQTWLGIAAYLLLGRPMAEHTKIFSVSALWALPEPGRVRVGGMCDNVLLVYPNLG